MIVPSDKTCHLSLDFVSASEMTYIVSGGALNSTHSLWTLSSLFESLAVYGSQASDAR